MSLSSSFTGRLLKEYQSLLSSPIDGITVRLGEDSLTNIIADFVGPDATPYAGGEFSIRLLFGSDYPSAPPKSNFLTKIFHPNVSKTGEICVNALKKDWKSTHGLRHILLVIRCLMIQPNPESALNEDAGKLLLENYDDYAKRAAIMTKIHAKPKTKNENNSNSASSNADNSICSASSCSSSSSSSSDSKVTLTASVSADSTPLANQENASGKIENRSNVANQNQSNVGQEKLTAIASQSAPAISQSVPASAPVVKKKPLKRL